MAIDKETEAIIQKYTGGKYDTITGIVVESVTEDQVVCSFIIDKELHTNVAGIVHGGAMYTLVDQCFGIHANFRLTRGETKYLTVTQSVSISYLKASRGTKLYATSKELHKGRSTCVYLVTVTDDLGITLATAICNGAVSAFPIL